ncbi:MAG: type VII toxin-antitoxin system HepT family RNase toxin [Candidatus Helarchaeota archaeon]
MYNDVIEAKLKKLEEILGILEQLRAEPKEKLKEDPIFYSALERNLEIAIQSILDIGNHLIAIKKWRTPKNYKDIIKILGEKGVIPKNFAQDIEKMAGLRNILVHSYLEIEEEKIINLLQKLDDFTAFMKYIKLFLEKNIN